MLIYSKKDEVLCQDCPGGDGSKVYVVTEGLSGMIKNLYLVCLATLAFDAKFMP